MDYASIENAKKLFYEDRIMESLLVFEDLLKENSDSYIQIWRELVMARTWDYSCLERLYGVMEKEEQLYLKSLAATFYYLASYLLSDKNDITSKVYETVISLGFQEHITQIKIAHSLLCGTFVKIDLSCLSEKDIGLPETYKEYYDSYKDIYSNCEPLERFIQQYVSPILLSKEQTLEELLEVVADLEDEPLVYSGNCAGCEAKCCLDGVYLDEDEAEVIKAFVAKYKDEFPDVPDEFIIHVKSMYEGMPDEIKTIAVPHNYKCDDFPEHFNKTKCIFVDDDGFCLLQKVAARHNLHPWAAKPRVCWAFPMEDIRYGMLYRPPRNQQEDDFYVEGEFPGYVSCLPCCKHHDDGVSWKYNNLFGIEYYLLMKKRGNLPEYKG